MISKLLAYLALAAFVLALGGFVVLAVWDVPVAQASVEKTLDNKPFLAGQ